VRASPWSSLWPVGELRPAATARPPQVCRRGRAPHGHLARAAAGELRPAAAGVRTAELRFGAARARIRQPRLPALDAAPPGSLPPRPNRRAYRSTRRAAHRICQPESPSPPIGFEFGSESRAVRRQHRIESSSQCGGGKMDISHTRSHMSVQRAKKLRTMVHMCEQLF
jgi:hypothetical protein